VFTSGQPEELYVPPGLVSSDECDDLWRGRTIVSPPYPTLLVDAVVIPWTAIHPVRELSVVAAPVVAGVVVSPHPHAPVEEVRATVS
jgi:hypothetical protein